MRLWIIQIAAALIISTTPWLASAQLPANEAGLEKVCVLNYEREIHPFTAQIKRIFLNNPHVILINEAKPSDFYNCVKQGVEEINIFAHALKLGENSPRAKLGYFIRMSSQEREAAISAGIRDTSADLTELNRQSDMMSCQTMTSSDPDSPGQKECHEITSKMRDSQKLLDFITHLPSDYPLYNQSVFLNRIFEMSRDYLAAQKAQGADIKLKSIRLMGCMPDAIIAEHTALADLIRENNISFRAAPKQEIMSLIKGEDVTTIDARWLGESAQFEDLGKTRGFYAYLPITTMGLSRSTPTESVLRGKYRISMKGLGLGLSKKWSPVFIRYSDVDSMKVGEIKTLSTPEVDVSLALWINGELQLGPTDKWVSPSEINSIGAAVGIYREIQVERLY